MAETLEPKFQVGALESPDPADPGFGEWAAAVTAAQALAQRRDQHALYPRATAVWSWPDGDCRAILYAGDLFKPG